MNDIIKNIISEMNNANSLSEVTFVMDITSNKNKKLINFLSELINTIQPLDISNKFLFTLFDYKFESIETFRTITINQIQNFNTNSKFDINVVIDYGKYMIDNNIGMKNMYILSDNIYELKESNIPFKLTWITTTEDIKSTYGEIIRI